MKVQIGKIEINVFGLICDAPAKSLVLKVKGHTGYNCCPKCKYKGVGIRPKQAGTQRKKSDEFVFREQDHLKKELMKNLKIIST